MDDDLLFDFFDEFNLLQDVRPSDDNRYFNPAHGQVSCRGTNRGRSARSARQQ